MTEFKFSVRPVGVIKYAVVMVSLLALVGIPQHIGKASDTPPYLTVKIDPVAEERASKIELVRGELAPRLDKATPAELRDVSVAIVDECQRTGVDPLFVLAIIESESNFDIEAVSPTGARGLMQLIPSTFKQMSTSKRMFDPAENVRAGIRYVKHLWDSGFGKRGGPESILLAYNQGPKMAVDIYKNGVPMPDEAQAYIPRVMAKYRTLLAKYGYKARDAKKLFLASR